MYVCMYVPRRFCPPAIQHQHQHSTYTHALWGNDTTRTMHARQDTISSVAVAVDVESSVEVGVGCRTYETLLYIPKFNGSLRLRVGGRYAGTHSLGLVAGMLGWASVAKGGGVGFVHVIVHMCVGGGVKARSPGEKKEQRPRREKGEEWEERR